ncbi:MAG: hypothetical protein IT392_11700 [Nitrospirae bacterium]|nr:hypothetical protein [Nitrospirota bacterium]
MNIAGVVIKRNWLWSALVLMLVCIFDSPEAKGGTDDLSEFLIPVDNSSSSEVVPRSGMKVSGRKRSGYLCSSKQGIRICKDPVSGEAISFTLFNVGSPKIVPEGQGLERSYRFKFEGRELQNIKMAVVEKSSVTGRASHLLMISSIYFFPRKVLPALRLIGKDTELRVLELELPTGERVCFDNETKEITGGVLNEDAPMDTNPNRHKRRFAKVSYNGGGVMIRVDQRGSTPEEAVVWGQKKMAAISYGSRTCKLSPEQLWEQDSGWFDFKFSTDESLYKFLKKACGWNDMELPIELPENTFTCQTALESHNRFYFSSGYIAENP